MVDLTTGIKTNNTYLLCLISSTFFKYLFKLEPAKNTLC